ncbi:hypothetical protein [Rhizobacter sp. Root1221]|nr:hypothetical protein [Rhizobacter sp. Root1221]
MPHAASPAPTPEIRIELKRSATTVSISWPTEFAAECVVWLRELLR